MPCEMILIFFGDPSSHNGNIGIVRFNRSPAVDISSIASTVNLIPVR